MLNKVTMLYMVAAFCGMTLFCDFPPRAAGSLNHPKKNAIAAVCILFKLQKNERCFLSYTNQFFEAKTLDFNNASNSDIVITKNIAANAPLILTSHIILLNKDKLSHTIKYILFARPNDTLRLSLTNKWYLNLADCKTENILCNGSNAFYTDDDILPAAKSAAPKIERWLAFYQLFSAQYVAESARLGRLFGGAKTDTTVRTQLLLACRLHYYKRLLDWVFEKDAKCFRPCLPVISEKMAEMELLLKDNNLASSNELLTVIDGLVRVKIINKNEDYTNGANIYDEALAANLGKFKPSYLSVCIVKSAVKQGADFNRILIDFEKRYQNTPYLVHVDSVLKSGTDANQITFNDPLVTLDGTTSAWKKVMDSKKYFVVIDFWASWCVPCRHQLPIFDSIRTVLHRAPVEFISINIDEVAADWKIASVAEKAYLGENNYHLLNAKKSAIVQQLKINAIPRYLILNNNKIISADYYQPSDPSFIKELEQLMHSPNR
jgi:thiol-disulfide isomerase/thioredoxin